MSTARLTLGGLLLALGLAGCAEPPAPTELPPRTIKHQTLEARAGSQSRLLSGVTEAGVVTELAFEVGGQLVELVPDLGAAVAAGDLIARLDPAPYELRRLTARGQLDEAEARAAEADSQFARVGELFEKQYVSRAEFDRALADLERARANVQIAGTQLAIAERDLAQTRLTSPLAGRVTDKYVERFQELAPGAPVVQISAEGRLRVRVSVPETLIGELAVGDRVTVRAGADHPGRIAEIGTRAGATSTFPVTAVLDAPVDDLFPGTTVDVELRFETAASGTAFRVPLTAVLALEDPGRGAVFVYDPASGTVGRRVVELVNVHGNDLQVTGDLAAGDVIATAGVPFLHDGMPVRLLGATEASHD